MPTPLRFRLAAAFASIAITGCLLAGIAEMARPPIGGALLAQSSTVAVH
jgi:hypothetical protein